MHAAAHVAPGCASATTFAIERETAGVRGSYEGKRFDGRNGTTRMWKRLPNGHW
jgi:hypothetical protein